MNNKELAKPTYSIIQYRTDINSNERYKRFLTPCHRNKNIHVGSQLCQECKYNKSTDIAKGTVECWLIKETADGKK